MDTVLKGFRFKFGSAALLLALLSLNVDAWTDRWCNITCNGESHTACAYENTPGDKCNNPTIIALSEKEKAIILREHNLLRSEIAIGNITGFPSASDMMELTWDDDLALVAQTWARQCIDKHDICRNLEAGYVGQNFGTFSSASLDELPYINLRVQHWFNEIADYQQGDGPAEYPEETEGFTQLVWSRTRRVGCGRTVYYSLEVEAIVDNIFCNYSPGGNIRGEVLYNKGSPCKECQCSERYSGLCV